MGVLTKEHPKGSGEYTIFINHKGWRRSKKIGKDKRLAKQVAQKIHAKLLLGEYPLEREETRANLPTFKAYACKWLKLPSERKHSSVEVYDYQLERHVYPEIGRRPIDEIKKPRLQALFDDLALDGYSKATIKLIAGAVSLVFDHAVEGGLIADNPALNLKVAGRKARKPNDPLTDIQTQQLLDCARQHEGGQYYPIFLYALRTGCRIGEIRATKWADIDFKKRFVEVKRNIVRGKYYSPKNGRNRRVGLSPLVIEELRALRTAQKRAALAGAHAVPELVFTGADGEIMRQHLIRDALKKCLKAAKLHRITFHDLRHTYAHIRLSRGHNLPDVSRSLGHADVKITMKIYGHLQLNDRFQNEIDSLDTPHLGASEAHLAGAEK